MPRFLPIFASFFKGKDITRFIAPPYDVIDEEDRKKLEKKSKYNIVRLVLPSTHDEARLIFLRWLSKGIIFQFPESGYFYLEAEVEDPIFGRGKLRGLFGRLQVEKFGRGVYPHEKTFSGPKKDRYELMRKAGASFSHVVGIYDGPEIEELLSGTLRGLQEVYRFSSEGMKGKLYFIGRKKEIFSAVMNSKILIADGHHRYETYISLSRDFPEVPEFSYVNFFLTSKRGGLNLHPTHRAARSAKTGDIEKRLGKKFRIERLAGEKALTVVPEDNEFVLVTRDGAFLLRYREDFSGIPTEVSDPFILSSLRAESVCYSPFFDKLFTYVLEGKVDFALRLPEFSIEKVFEEVEKGKRLPQKTTYFYPKIPSGLLIYRFF